MKLLISTLGLCVLAAACGDDSSSIQHDAGGDGGSGCTLTLTGTLALTAPCVVTASFQFSTGITTLGLLAQPVPTGYDSLTVSLETSGDLAIKSYPGVELSGGASIHVSDGRFFQAMVGASTVGNISKFEVTAKTPLTNDGTVATYGIHGSFAGVLPGIDITGQPGGGNVTMTATF